MLNFAGVSLSYYLQGFTNRKYQCQGLNMVEQGRKSYQNRLHRLKVMMKHYIIYILSNHQSQA